MKISVDPRKDYKTAPKTAKLVYMLLWGMALSFAISQIFATIQGLSIFFLIGSLFLSYVVIDTGLVVLRGRAMARGLSTFFSLAAIATAILTYLHIMAGDSIVFAFTALSAVFGLLVIITVNTKSVKEHVNAAGNKSVITTNKNSKSKKNDNEIKAGSWADIMAQEEAARNAETE